MRDAQLANEKPAAMNAMETAPRARRTCASFMRRSVSYGPGLSRRAGTRSRSSPGRPSRGDPGRSPCVSARASRADQRPGAGLLPVLVEGGGEGALDLGGELFFFPGLGGDEADEGGGLVVEGDFVAGGVDDLAGDEAGAGGGEVGDGGGDVVGGALGGGGVGAGGAAALVGDGVGHAGGGAGGDGVGGGAVAAEGVGEGVGEADDAELGGGVVGLAGGAV